MMAAEKKPSQDPAKNEPMMKHFRSADLPPSSVEIGRPFEGLATNICNALKPGPERTVCLRKLLESRDCAVRAHLYPNG